MRLRRIEAVRYGRLADASLGEIGDGLTIVEGPNEAGKSSFTSLVRHVLYGFPTAREKERQYHSPAGKRQGRLVFEEDGSRWVIERTEGAHGGTTEVRVLQGASRPALLGEVTAGVSPLAFKVVFGFGLDEMAHIESLRGSDDDILARLYAASAGLAISPHDVRTSLEKAAEEIFTPRGKTKRVNAILAEMREARAELRILEDEAASFVADRERLSELDAQLEVARSSRDECRAAYTDVARASDRLAERIASVDALEQELVGLRAESMAVTATLDKSEPDARVIAVMAELEALIDEASAHTQGRTDLRDAEATRAQALRRLDEAVSRTGLTADEVLAMGTGPEAQREIEAARDELQRLDMELETRRREVERFQMDVAEATKSVASACHGVGVDPSTAREVIADRYAAVETLEGFRPAATVAGPDIPSLVLLGSGLVAAVAGVSLGEYLAVMIGAVLTVAGGFFMLRRKMMAGRIEDAPTSALEALGLSTPPTGMELARIRRTLDACRTAISAEDDALRDQAKATREANLAKSTLSARRTLWARWLEERGLSGDMTPADASQTLALARDALNLRSAADDSEDAVRRLKERTNGYARRLAGVLALFTEVAAEPGEDDIPLLVSKARQTLNDTRQVIASRDEAMRVMRDLETRIGVAEQKAAHASEDAAKILGEWSIADGGSLESMAERKRLELEDTERAHDQLADERSRLDERLAERTREVRGGELRLRISGLEERLKNAAEEYATLSVAAHLVAKTQERYERERQPEVVRRAQEAFRSITGERYVGLAVPIAGGAVEVFDARSDVKTSGELSRGTAEQMYLALRLGLIGQLDDVGVGLPVLMDDVLVNFDPERRRGSAEAIAALADHRQVVLFTCHPETAELLTAVKPDATHLRLDRC